MPLRKYFAVLALPFLCLYFPSTAEAQTAYTIQDIGLVNPLTAQVVGLNNYGEITTTGARGGGIIYSHGLIQKLDGVFVGNINDNGQIPISRYSNGQASLFDSRTENTQVVGPPLPILTSANAVNQNGDVAGTITVQSQPTVIKNAALFRSGQTIDLGSLSGGMGSNATALNERGEVTGYGTVASGDNHAFLYSGGFMRDLGTLPGFTSSEATSINNKGYIVGSSSVANELGFADSHAFLYQNGVMQDLGTFGGRSSDALGINDSGVVVGSAQMPGNDGLGPSAPFVYRSGIMRNLFDLVPDTLSWSFGGAGAINDRGQIAGVAYHNGQRVLFLATPTAVPEPGAVALFATGLLIFNGWMRRRVRAT